MFACLSLVYKVVLLWYETSISGIFNQSTYIRKLKQIYLFYIFFQNIKLMYQYTNIHENIDLKDKTKNIPKNPQ